MRLFPVRGTTRSRRQWRYRMQVLGTVLIWARCANATKVDYSFDRSEPFRYFDEAFQEVKSEFVQPPEELRPDLAHVLFLNAIDGHPLIRPWRRLLRWSFGWYTTALLRVPDPENQTESEWMMVVNGQHAEFELLATRPLLLSE
ncbi:hypothetical protein [Rhodopirellula bahusiensis]|uniref:hypothetical protein n=1 Tax=Rhodopirellula bahusiensis TaxID=2014065 RepID=UPI003265F281